MTPLLDIRISTLGQKVLDDSRMVVEDGQYYGAIAAAPDGSLWVAGPAGIEIVSGVGGQP